MAIIPPSLPTPIFTLDRKTMHRIFSLNIECDHDIPSYLGPQYINGLPLNNTRRASQVCRSWRNTLLNSPLIWAGCLQLDLLDQRSDNWRALVLQRTGQSLLSVMGRGRMVQGRGVSSFFFHLLDHHYARIRNFDVLLRHPILHDSRTWVAFGRPSNVMQEFVVLQHRNEVSLRLPLVNLPLDFQLFANHAPSLTRLQLPQSFNMVPLMLTATPIIFTVNMRHLHLSDRPLHLSDADLLTACRQMPSIESLHISLTTFTTSDRYDSNDSRLSLPCLERIYIISPTLRIYDTFLDRIDPHPGCALRVFRRYKRGDIEPLGRSALGMCNKMALITKRYLLSAVHYHSKNANFTRDMGTYMSLKLGIKLFIAASPAVILIDFETRARMSSLIFELLLNAVLTIKFLDTLTRLELDITKTHVDLLFSLPLKHILATMEHITVIDTTSSSLSYIDRISDDENVLFPCLDTVILTESGQEEVTLGRRIDVHRKPIEILDLTSIELPLGDLRYLDRFHGLKAVYYSPRYAGPMEYICGSGDGEQLFESSLSEDEDEVDGIYSPSRL